MTQQVLLCGGPGDGQQVKVGDDWDLIKWVPSDDAERVVARMEGHEAKDNDRDPVQYRRSLRSRRKFVYQP